MLTIAKVALLIGIACFIFAFFDNRVNFGALGFVFFGVGISIMFLRDAFAPKLTTMSTDPDANVFRRWMAIALLSATAIIGIAAGMKLLTLSAAAISFVFVSVLAFFLLIRK
jgi:hypothetical protein